MGMSKYGDWVRAGVVLQSLGTNLYKICEAQLREDGELILKKLQGHIDNQDLSWTPLAESTIRIKNGDATIYVESGYLRDNLEVRKVKSSASNVTMFIGASAWKSTKEGVNLSDLMIWLEYGTNKMPPRPLIRPTWDEVESLIKNNWVALLGSLVSKVGG